mgnify:CR=1 FL=1
MDSQTFDALVLGIQNLANPQVIFALVIGAIGGLIIGAVPGIGPAIAIAILLPATVFLDDLVALVLLLGVYGSSMYGGAIPAILINTPGTPVNALTTYDGHSMTRRGQAGRALSLAYSASFFGGMFSICVALIALLGFGPYLRDLGALFGSRDIFMAALLGAVLLVAAHRQNMLIATLMFCVGGLIAIVGRSQTRQYNGERIELFTYDLEVMSSGFNLIVVIVGIFAISQALNLLTGKDDDPPEAKLTGGLFRGLTELRKHPFVAACSAAYGTIMGIIPGVGEFVAQFFSYSTADGLIASETANNAVPAAAMIPLLALGVPGEALTAMMMVVFFDAGIKPGPDIFENNSDFLFSLFIALMIINVLVLITLLFTTRWVAKMVYIPNRFLGVLILVLAFVGVFSIQNRLEDCIIAAAFGFVGFILRRLDWPLVPIVLGMVLGNIMLERLTAGAGQVVTLVGLFSRWVSGVLAVVILGIIIFTIISLIMERRRKT